MIRTDTDQVRDFGRNQEAIFDFYTCPGPLTSTGRYTPYMDALPRDVPGLVRVVQGLAIHEYMASAYGITVPEERKPESHIRSVEEMLGRILAIDNRPLTIPRQPEKRLVGVCQHFSSLMVAMLQAKGIPARARYGFGSYFNPGYFEEHIVSEYWNAGEGRWVLVDTQFDEIWRSKLRVDHDVLDVPRDRFLVAGDAWSQYRAGARNPARFGIFVGEQRGAWFIAGELVRDIAGLNKMEMLPWDQWGAIPRPGEQVGNDPLAYYDRLAALSQSPDASFKALRQLYIGDQRVQVPPVVFNAVLNREEPVAVAA
ncbi:MAG: transglutaminase-like domain-containing protein [Gemmatimonadota bacterium]